jgi:hypothetical protein
VRRTLLAKTLHEVMSAQVMALPNLKVSQKYDGLRVCVCVCLCVRCCVYMRVCMHVVCFNEAESLMMMKEFSAFCFFCAD